MQFTFIIEYSFFFAKCITVQIKRYRHRHVRLAVKNHDSPLVALVYWGDMFYSMSLRDEEDPNMKMPVPVPSTVG